MKLFGINLFGTRQSTAASSGSDLSKSGERSSWLKEPVDTVSHAHVDDMDLEQNIPDKSKANIALPDNSDNQGTPTTDNNAGNNTTSDPHSFAGIPVSSGTPTPSSAPSPLDIPAPTFPPYSTSPNVPPSLHGSKGLTIYAPVSGNRNSALSAYSGMIGGAIGGIAGGLGMGAAGSAGAVIGAAVGSAGLGAGLNSNWNSALLKMNSETLTPEERLAKKEEEARGQLTEMIETLEGDQSNGEQKIVQSETHVSIGGVVLKKQR